MRDKVLRVEDVNLVVIIIYHQRIFDGLDIIDFAGVILQKQFALELAALEIVVQRNILGVLNLHDFVAVIQIDLILGLNKEVLNFSQVLCHI